jgi:hypothetical protein
LLRVWDSDTVTLSLGLLLAGQALARQDSPGEEAPVFIVPR